LDLSLCPGEFRQARIIEANDIDLVITDLAMPERERFEITQRLHHSRPAFRMVAISSEFLGILRASEYFGAAAIRKPIGASMQPSCVPASGIHPA
jgi:CheY-like chemotaxis protein